MKLSVYVPTTARAGSALVSALVLSGLLLAAITAMVQLTSFRMKMEYGRSYSNQAFYHAENALNWACQVMADANQGGSSAPFLGNYSVGNGTLAVPYQAALQSGEDPRFVETWVTISNHPSNTENLYQVTSSCKVGERTRTIQASVRKNPPSQVFDYEYFLNNWGWWWGASLTGNGDNRANWDFDFRFGPTLNGAILANGRIESASQVVDPLAGPTPFIGLAGSDPVSYVKTGVPRVKMPSLQNMDYYKQKAVEAGGTLSVGSTLLVSAVHTNTTKPGLYLVGTTDQPIVVDGPVVVPGDVVIKGVVTGIGTLYVGGNLYVAGNVTYKNGPSFSSAPALMSPANQDSWVESAVDQQKDLVAFAVAESILAGGVNTAEWKLRCYDAASYGLKNVGNESNLGEDGIAQTPDDGVNYLDTNGDGQADSAWYDADDDGAVDGFYNYDNQLFMSSTRAGLISGYPTSSGSPVNFDSVASNYMNRLDGIFYCNHAMGMRFQQTGSVINGAIICRDEAILYSGSLKFNYDPRIHSRYSDDPNRYIDLGLPIAQRVRIEQMAELAPQEGFYAAN